MVFTAACTYVSHQSTPITKMNPEQLRQQLILTNPDTATVEAFDRVLDSGSIVKSDVCPVLDTEGNPLVIDGIYEYRKNSFGKLIPLKIKVRRWSFGFGNIRDRYYRVFYTDENLNDTFLVVDASYPNGIFGGAVYRSTLKNLVCG